MINVLAPWEPLDAARARLLDEELLLEMHPRHVLAGKQYRAIAARGDRDDVLFEIAGLGYAVVHLTWSSGPETSPWPMTEVYASLDDWVERRMRPDHQDFSS